MKAAARDFRGVIVHIDVVADYVHRQTTSGSTNSDNVTVLENKASISGHRNDLKSTVTEKHVDDTDLSRDRNQNCKSTNVGTYNVDNDSKFVELLPETKETAMTSSNKLADSNNNRSVYNDSTAYNSTENKLLHRIPVLDNTTSAGNRVRPRRTVTTTMQTTKTAKRSVSRNVAIQDVASCVRRTAEVVCTEVASPRDEDVPTTGSDQSNYSGIYERDLEEILESVATVNCHIRHRRRRRPQNAATFRLSDQRADKSSFRLPWSPEVQSYRSSPDSCYGRSDSESEPERKWTSEDDLNSDEDPAAALNSDTFFRRLNHFLLNGNWGPEMAIIEP